jgi:cytochrome c oxidase subunit 2
MAPPVTSPHRRSRLRRARALATLVLTASVTTLAAGCAGDDSGPVLSAEQAQGRQVAKDRGCTSCHTSTGDKSEGPTWKGLAGSTVRLADGTSVVADDAYLTRSIKEPRAQVVQGYRTPMPVQPVTDADIAAIVTYIKALK